MSTELGKASLAEVMIDTGLSWRLLLFLILPLFLVWVAGDARRLGDPLLLTRLGSFRSWLRHAAVESAGRALALFACLLGPAAAVGLGAFPAEVWRDAPASLVGTWSDILLAGAMVCSVAINLSLLGVLVLVAALAGGRTGALITAVLIFALAIVGSGSPFRFAPLNLGYGIQPLASIEHYGSTSLALLVPTAVSATLVLLSVWVLQARHGGRLRFRGAWVAMVGIGLMITLRLTLGEWDDRDHALLAAFYGSGGTIIDQLFVAIVVLAPSWLALTQGEERYEGMNAEMIRSGTAGRWYWRAIARPLLLFPAYLAAVVTLSAGLLLLRFPELPPGEQVPAVSPGAVSYHVVVNGLLQGWCFLGFVTACRWLAGAPWGGLAGLGALFAAGWVLPGSPLVAVGVGLLVEGRDPHASTPALLSGLVLLAVATGTITSKKCGFLTERNLAQ
ncbi:MAG: hypothetical protein WAS07_12225 [Micropruina sp.]